MAQCPPVTLPLVLAIALLAPGLLTLVAAVVYLGFGRGRHDEDGT